MADLSYRLRKWLEERFQASGHTQSALAKFLGIAPSAVSRILQGQRQITAIELLGMLDFLNISFTDVNVALGNALDISEEIIRSQGSDMITKDAPLSSSKFWNTETVLPYDEEKSEFNLPHDILAGIKYDKDYLRYVRVEDESMYPTLKVGDFIVVDLSIRLPHGPGIYLLEFANNSLAFRRLDEVSILDDTRLKVTVACDNPRFRTQELPLERITILGRAIVRITTNIA